MWLSLVGPWRPYPYPGGTSARPAGRLAGPAGHAEPTVDRAAIRAEDPGDRGRLLPLTDGRDGALAAALQLRDGNAGTHALFYAVAA